MPPKTLLKTDHIPVFIFAQPIVSGVVSWVYRLKKAFDNHPNYQIILVQIGKNHAKDEQYDLLLEDKPSFDAFFRSVPKGIIIPNWVFHTIPWLCQFNKRGANLQIIGVCHSDTAEEYYNPLVWAEPGVSHYVAVSPTIESTLKALMPARRSDVTQIIYGIDVADRLKRRYQTKPIRLVYAGRIVQKQKRVLDFPRLVEILIERGVNFQLKIAGAGTAEPILRTALRKHGRYVSFLGKVAPQNVPKLWRANDIFLQVSDFEGTSVSMLEAMAEGLIPVVTDSSSGVRSVIQPGQNGFVVPIGNMNDTATVIETLAQHPDWLPAIGGNAHQTAQQYNLPQHAKQYEALFDKVMQRPAPKWESPRAWKPSFVQSTEGKQDTKIVFALSKDSNTRQWMMNASQHLSSRGQMSVLIEHDALSTLDERDFGVYIQCAAGENKMTRQNVYHSSLPAIFMLGKDAAAYRACAALTQDDAENVRVVAYVAEDYDTALSFRSMIHTFIFTDQILANEFRNHVPERHADIVTIKEHDHPTYIVGRWLRDLLMQTWDKKPRLWSNGNPIG